MVYIMAGNKPDEWSPHETTYQTQYMKWNGFVDRNPVLRQIIDIRAASVFSSFTVKGTHNRQAKKILRDMDGRNNESFKSIMANLYRLAYICGDAYAEKIYEGDPADGKIVNLEILPSDNVRQIVKKGKIIRYEEINLSGDGNPVTWEPFRIFHVKYNPRGAQSHGLGMIEGMNNMLVSREQLMQIAQETYERTSRPRELILANTDNKAKLDMIRDAIKVAGDTWSGVAVIPGSLITDVKDIQLTSTMKPQELVAVIDADIFKATATPEIMLGAGYANSEESIESHLAGFLGSIRYDQETFEDMVCKQIFEEIWPTNPPEIEFSFRHEAHDDKYNRVMQSIPIIDASTTIAPENKDLIITDQLEDIGLLT